MPKRKFELEYNARSILLSKSWKESREYELSFMVGDTLLLCTLSLDDVEIRINGPGCLGILWPLKHLHEFSYLKPILKHEIETLDDFDDFEDLDETIRIKIFDAILCRAKELFRTFAPCDVCGVLFHPKGKRSVTCSRCLSSMSLSLVTDEVCHMCMEKKKIQFLCTCSGSATCFGCVQKWLKEKNHDVMQCTTCRGKNDAMFITNGQCMEIKGHDKK